MKVGTVKDNDTKLGVVLGKDGVLDSNWTSDET